MVEVSPARAYYRCMRKTLLPTLLLFAVCAIVPGRVASADVLKYQDDEGKTHYVDTPEKVPEKYRSQLKDQAKLPEISRSNSGGRQLYEKKTYSSSSAALAPVEIFVTSWCGYCKKLEAFLDKEGVRYTRYDIESSAKGKKLHDELGGGGVPTVRIGKQIIHGFDVEKLKSVLGLDRDGAAKMSGVKT